MTWEYEVLVEGEIHTVTISDEPQTLLAARAAGRVVVGYLHEGGDQELSAAEYLIEMPETADARYLERIVRRHLGLPWVIAESERLTIRELTPEDAGGLTGVGDIMEQDFPVEPLLFEPSALDAYIRNQYRFYEYGIWAVVRRADDTLIGIAGVSDCDIHRGTDTNMQLELGYHIFRPYRRQGYAEEACRTILDYVRRELDCPVYAVTDSANEGSIRLLRKLGFVVIGQRHNAEMQPHCLYGWNC